MTDEKALIASATVALRDCLAVQACESVLILTDTVCRPIGRAFFESALGLGLYAVYVEIPVMQRNGQEPNDSVARLMRDFSLVVAPTEKSLTHTAARRDACAAGARVATMPGIREDTVIRCLGADHDAIAARTEAVAEILEKGEAVRVTTKTGTDLSFSIRGVHAHASTGLVRKSGTFGNLPSGEAYLRPLEGTANGVVVIDGSMAGIGDLQPAGEVIRVKIRDGLAVEITGGPSADRLREMLTAVGPDAFTVAEFGVGTNDAARIIGCILEDEKVMGTIHVAFGNNVSMGGTVDVPIHLDGIVRDPSVDVDGRPLMRDGALLLGE
ncbi:MAG: aminopeptidase [Acidobacteria bacterium]|nr:aminopeptidase [Acidobacteriota bacterium]